MINICNRHNVKKEKLYIEEYGYDTLSQLRFTLNICKINNQNLLIVSSLTHYPRVIWIVNRLNKKYKVNVKHEIALGIPRLHDALYDIPLILIYPIIDLLGFSDKFSRIIKNRRANGYL